MEKSSFDREPMWKMNRPVDEPLTKRERFAMAAMQGILSKQAGVDDQLGDLTTQNMDKVAETSTQFADSLLTKLQETNED